MRLHQIFSLIAGSFTFMTMVVIIWTIYNHLYSWREPRLQKYIVRILIMVPVYSIDSYLSLLFKDLSLYFDVMRDCYEAYVLYLFFTLLVQFLGGEDSLRGLLEEKPPVAHPFPLCKLHSKTGALFLYRCKLFILQFMIVKPVLALVTIGLELASLYDAGKFRIDRGYLWITVLDNISITAPFRPLAKFLCIKAVIFFAFWQGVAIAVLAHFGVIKAHGDWTTDNVATGTQDFIICIQMFFLALAYAYAFGSSTYRDPNASAKAVLSELSELRHMRTHFSTLREEGPRIIKNFAEVANVRDVLDDTVVSMTRAPRKHVVIGDFLTLERSDQLLRVSKRGYLYKKGDDLMRKWRQRFCLLLTRPPGIAYYEKDPFTSDETVLPLGFVDFTSIISVQATEKAMWRFKASSSEECLYWLQSVSQLWSGLQSADASVMSWDDDENDNDEVALLGPQKEKAALIPRDPEP